MANGEKVTQIPPRPKNEPKILQQFNIYDKLTKTDAQILAQVNPNYSTGKYEWIHNCQKCVVAWELLNRGYDVTAKPTGANFEEYKKDFLGKGGNFFKAFNNPQLFRCANLSEIEILIKSWGNGARVAIQAVWRGRATAHVFCAKNVSGKVHFLDPQTANSDVRYYFEKVDFSRTVICRLDILSITDLAAECCEGVK